MPEPIAIPPRTTATRCNSRTCNALIYWVQTPAGKKLPVSVDRANPQHAFPTYTAPGAGHAHFADCIDADRWRRKKVAK